MSISSIGIFVATMTGLAEMCAEEARDILLQQGFQSEIRLMDGLDGGAFDDVDIIVIVSSTYGHGDIPDNGQALFEALQGPSSLTGKHFAVFALGDRTYADTFCHAGEQWDRLLEEKGATRIFPLERHDASAGTLAEDEAAGWAARWTPLLKRAA